MGCTAAKAATLEGPIAAGRTLLTSTPDWKARPCRSPSADQGTPRSGPPQPRTPKSVGHVQGPGSDLGEEPADRGAEPEDAPACPRRLWVVSPPRPALQGEYVRLPAWSANGEPIWRLRTGDACLFSCSTGRWMLTDHHSKIEMDQGEIKSADKHYHKLPQECSRWMYGEDSKWTADTKGVTIITSNKVVAKRLMRQQEYRSTGKKQTASLRAVLAPETLWIAVPPRPALQGEYCRVQDRVENGQPLWREARGGGWLFSSAGGHWVVCRKEPGAAKNQAELRTSLPHSGKWPQEVKEWKYTRSGTLEWVTDSVRAIQVSTDASATQAALKNYDFFAGVESPREESCDMPCIG